MIFQKDQNKEYSVAGGDFTVIVAGSSKVAVLVGADFTPTANAITSAFYRTVAGLRIDIPLTTVTVSGTSITFADMPADFLSTDTVEIYFKGAKKGYSSSADTERNNEIAPLNLDYVSDSLVDTTNLAGATYYYYLDMDGFKDLSLTGKLIDADDDLTLTFEYTNDEDKTTADWISCYARDDKNNSTVNTQICSSSTVTFAMSFSNAGAYKYMRIKLVVVTATNTVIIKAKRKAL